MRACSAPVTLGPRAAGLANPRLGARIHTGALWVMEATLGQTLASPETSLCIVEAFRQPHSPGGPLIKAVRVRALLLVGAEYPGQPSLIRLLAGSWNHLGFAALARSVARRSHREISQLKQCVADEPLIEELAETATAKKSVVLPQSP